MVYNKTQKTNFLTETVKRKEVHTSGQVWRKDRPQKAKIRKTHKHTGKSSESVCAGKCCSVIQMCFSFKAALFSSNWEWECDHDRQTSELCCCSKLSFRKNCSSQQLPLWCHWGYCWCTFSVHWSAVPMQKWKAGSWIQQLMICLYTTRVLLFSEEDHRIGSFWDNFFSVFLVLLLLLSSAANRCHTDTFAVRPKKKGHRRLKDV